MKTSHQLSLQNLEISKVILTGDNKEIKPGGRGQTEKKEEKDNSSIKSLKDNSLRRFI